VFNSCAKLAESPATVGAAAMSGDLEAAAVHPVLVVDDDASVRDSLSALLDAFGFEVFTYSSGSQLLTDDRRRCAGVLIVDQHMPEMDGIEVLSALRGEGIDAPAILITGRLDPAISAHAALIGVAAILEKPFPTAKLAELVRSSLEKKK
jgi:two-component system, LuxR family, response regulator FixJ